MIYFAIILELIIYFFLLREVWVYNDLDYKLQDCIIVTGIFGFIIFFTVLFFVAYPNGEGARL